jgi:hypothetical protein
MAGILYGLHIWMDDATEPTGAVHVSATPSYVQSPMHCPFNARFALVQHKFEVGACDGFGPVVGPLVGPVVGPLVGPVVGPLVVSVVKSPNNPVAGAAVFAMDIAPGLPAF